MAAQKQGNTIDITRPIRDVAHAIARRSEAKERARQFDQRMALQKAKFQHQQQRDNTNTKLAQDKQKHKVKMDYQKNKDTQAKIQLAKDKLDEAKKTRQTRNKLNGWKENNRTKQFGEKMDHAKNVLNEKTKHDQVSEAIKNRNSDLYGDYVKNQINRGNAAIESQKQNAEIKKQATGADYNANSFNQTKQPSDKSFSDTINTLRPGGSSLGGTPGKKDIFHTKQSFSVEKGKAL